MLSPEQIKALATREIMPKDTRGLRCSYQVAMISITQWNALWKLQKDDEASKENESFVPGKAPPEFEEGGKLP